MLQGTAPDVVEQLEIDARYAGYLERQDADILAFRRDEELLLPERLDYAAICGLSTECRLKLAAVRPRTLGQAARIDGVTPAALTLVLAHVRAGAPPACRRGLTPSVPRSSPPQPVFHVKHSTGSKRYAALLEDWNSRHNLVSRASMADLWRRHFWDSAQVAALIPATARTLVDLGSGAGFPGLVLAELRPDLQVTLIEATAKKCRFLQAVADELGLRPEIRSSANRGRARQGLRRHHRTGLRAAAGSAWLMHRDSGAQAAEPSCTRDKI